MRVLWVLVLLLLSAPAFGEVYSHPNPKFQITIPDGYLRLSRPQGMADAHCVFGKNHHEGVNDIKIAIADTGDSIYDSAIFVANITVGGVTVLKNVL